MRTLQTELKRHGLHKKIRVATYRQEPIKNSEKLSKREIESLMGKYRQTYKRVRGAVRRK